MTAFLFLLPAIDRVDDVFWIQARKSCSGKKTCRRTRALSDITDDQVFTGNRQEDNILRSTWITLDNPNWEGMETAYLEWKQNCILTLRWVFQFADFQSKNERCHILSVLYCLFTNVTLFFQFPRGLKPPFRTLPLLVLFSPVQKKSCSPPPLSAILFPPERQRKLVCLVPSAEHVGSSLE